MRGNGTIITTTKVCTAVLTQSVTGGLASATAMEITNGMLVNLLTTAHRLTDMDVAKGHLMQECLVMEVLKTKVCIRKWTETFCATQNAVTTIACIFCMSKPAAKTRLFSITLLCMETQNMEISPCSICQTRMECVKMLRTAKNVRECHCIGTHTHKTVKTTILVHGSSRVSRSTSRHAVFSCLRNWTKRARASPSHTMEVTNQTDRIVWT